MIVGIVFFVLTLAVAFATWWYVGVLDTRTAAGRSSRRGVFSKKGEDKGAKGEKLKNREKGFTAGNIWGIEDIRNGVLVCENGWYRMILKIGSIDYFLMNEGEQYSVESALMACAMAVNFPIQLFSTTEMVDTKNCALAIRAYLQSGAAQRGEIPAAMLEYGMNIYSYLDGLMQNRSVHNRPRYIVISCHTLDGLEKARGELMRRAQTLIEGLRRAKISAELLNSDRVEDVLFRFCNRGRVFRPSDAVAEGALDLYVTGRRVVPRAFEKEEEVRRAERTA